MQPNVIFILCIKNIYGCQDKFLNIKLSMFWIYITVVMKTNLRKFNSQKLIFGRICGLAFKRSGYFPREPVWFTAPTWWQTAICFSNSKRPETLFRHLGQCTFVIHICVQLCTDIHKISANKSSKKQYFS